jgi:DNA polymerase III subunit beta
MKFTAPKNALKTALEATVKATTTKGSLQILAGVRIDAEGDRLSFTGSNRDLTIRTKCDASIETTGSVIASGAVLLGMVSNFAGKDITFTSTDDGLNLSDGSVSYDIGTYDTSEWPRLPEVPSEMVELDTKRFLDGLANVIVAVSKDDTRPLLTSIRIDQVDGGVVLAATDSFRLATCVVSDVSMGESANVPSMAMDAVLKVAKSEKLGLHVTANEAHFRSGDTTVTTQLIEGQYPPYRNLLQKPGSTLKVSAKALGDAVKRTLILKDNDVPVVLTLSEGSLTVSYASRSVRGMSSETVDCEWNGHEGFRVGYNSTYLIDGLNRANGIIDVNIIDNLKPAQFTENGFLYLLMPVKMAATA